MDRVARGAAEQLPGGFVGGLASDVPQGHVDCTDGVDDGAAPAVHAAADVELLPEAIGVEWVFAD